MQHYDSLIKPSLCRKSQKSKTPPLASAGDKIAKYEQSKAKRATFTASYFHCAPRFMQRALNSARTAESIYIPHVIEI